VKTEFRFNNEPMTSGSLCELSQNRRLQQWIDKIFPLIRNEFNSKEIKLTFIGTAWDAADVRDAVSQFCQDNTEIIVNDEYVVNNNSVDQKLSSLKQLFERARSGPFDEFKTEQMERTFANALAPEFEVNVLATMSAGKSTVINAMIGKELMPSKNEACTATIAKIYDHDDMKEFEARRLGCDEQILDEWKLVSLDLISNWNDDPDTLTIEIKGNIPAINEREGVRLVLIDTPGPNNSRDDTHRRATLRAIKSKQPSMVLYVLNATQLSTDDDKNLLHLIKDAMADGGREAQDRFIFIANKIDNFDPEKGESVANALNNVREYLQRNGILNPIVIPASAELTKLIRMSEFQGRDTLSRKQKGSLNTFVELFFEEDEMNMLTHVKKDIDSSIYHSLKEKINIYKSQNDRDKAAEILSGIPIIEALLDKYISKHAIPARLKDAVDIFKIVAAKNEVLKTTSAIITQSQTEIAEIAENIKKFQIDEQRIQNAKEFRQNVSSMVYQISDNSTEQRKNIDREINRLLDELRKEFLVKVKPSEATRLLNNAEKKAMNLIVEIQEILTVALNNELFSTLDKLRSDYQLYISELINKSFPENGSINVIRELQSASFQMPDVETLIKNATYTESHQKFVGTERHGFLWLKKRDVYKTIHEDFVDLSEAALDVEEGLQLAKMKNLYSFEDSARKNLRIAKSTLLNQMDGIDAKFELTVNEINRANESKVEQEKIIAENQMKITWFRNFQDELDAILSID
jgi:hypothetical protein